MLMAENVDVETSRAYKVVCNKLTPSDLGKLKFLLSDKLNVNALYDAKEASAVFRLCERQHRTLDFLSDLLLLLNRSDILSHFDRTRSTMWTQSSITSSSTPDLVQSQLISNRRRLLYRLVDEKQLHKRNLSCLVLFHGLNSDFADCEWPYVIEELLHTKLLHEDAGEAAVKEWIRSYIDVAIAEYTDADQQVGQPRVIPQHCTEPVDLVDIAQVPAELPSSDEYYGSIDRVSEQEMRGCYSDTDTLGESQSAVVYSAEVEVQQVTQPTTSDVDNDNRRAQHRQVSAVSGSASASSEMSFMAPKYKKSMGKRVCLLIYESEKFKEDCETMANVLRRDQLDPKGSNNIKVLSAEDFKHTALDVIQEVESTIYEKVIKKVTRPVREHEDVIDLQLLTYYAYSSFRLVKAREVFAQRKYFRVLLPKNLREDTGGHLDKLVEIVFERWIFWADLIVFTELCFAQQTHLLRLFMTTAECSIDALVFPLIKEHLNPSNVLLDFVEKSLNTFIVDQKRDLECLRKELNVEEDFILSLADLLFSISVYCTGFPVGKPMALKGKEWSVSSDYRVIYEKMLKSFVPPSTPLEKNREDTSKYLKFCNNLNAVIHYLICGDIFLCEDWLWIHYSGHNKPSSKYVPCVPFDNLADVLDICFKYFSNVVISLDCCYPNISTDLSLDKVTGMLACQSHCTTEYTDSENLSHFTKQLAAALTGCDPRECPFRKNSSPCDFCVKLHDEIMRSGFVFPSHVFKFFVGHHGKPYIRYICNEPLVSAPVAQ